MILYQVSFRDNEDNCTFKLFATPKEAQEFINTDWSNEYGEIISNEPQLLKLTSTSKTDILKFINNLSY